MKLVENSLLPDSYFYTSDSDKEYDIQALRRVEYTLMTMESNYHAMLWKYLCFMCDRGGLELLLGA